MQSVFDELGERLKRDPRLTKNRIARADLGLLLFNYRDDLRALWLAAERGLAAPESADELRLAVERLRPLFGERS